MKIGIVFMNTIKNTLNPYLQKLFSCNTGTPHATLPQINRVLRERLDSFNLEIKRLQKDPKIQELTNKFPQTPESMCLMQTIELQEALKETHFVFNHGANSHMMILHMTAKKTLEIFEKKTFSHFEILRHPVFLAHLSKQHDIAYFKEAMNHHLEHTYRNEVLSADICLNNKEHKESAYSFFATNNTNVYQSQFLERTLETILKHYAPQTKIETAKKITDLGKDISSGCLYSICIPHQAFTSTGYLSRAFGYPLEKHHTLSDIRLCQDGYSSHLMSYGSFPQVRLLTHQLSPNRDIFILPHTTLDKKQLTELEKKISNLLSL